MTTAALHFHLPDDKLVIDRNSHGDTYWLEIKDADSRISFCIFGRPDELDAFIDLIAAKR